MVFHWLGTVECHISQRMNLVKLWRFVQRHGGSRRQRQGITAVSSRVPIMTREPASLSLNCCEQYRGCCMQVTSAGSSMSILPTGGELQAQGHYAKKASPSALLAADVNHWHGTSRKFS